MAIAWLQKDVSGYWNGIGDYVNVVCGSRQKTRLSTANLVLRRDWLKKRNLKRKRRFGIISKKIKLTTAGNFHTNACTQ